MWAERRVMPVGGRHRRGCPVAAALHGVLHCRHDVYGRLLQVDRGNVEAIRQMAQLALESTTAWPVSNPLQLVAEVRGNHAELGRGGLT